MKELPRRAALFSAGAGGLAGQDAAGEGLAARAKSRQDGERATAGRTRARSRMRARRRPLRVINVHLNAALDQLPGARN